MSTRQRVLLGLTVLGFLVPNTMVVIFLVEHGLDLERYFDEWFDSLPAAQLSMDLGIAAFSFVLWAAWEGRDRGMRSWWVPIPASLLVGICFGLPLFLFLRERSLDQSRLRSTSRSSLPR